MYFKMGTLEKNIEYYMGSLMKHIYPSKTNSCLAVCRTCKNCIIEQSKVGPTNHRNLPNMIAMETTCGKKQDNNITVLR